MNELQKLINCNFSDHNASINFMNEVQYGEEIDN